MIITYSNEKEGTYTVIIQDPDDLWHLSNIVFPDDTAKMLTYRREETGADQIRAKRGEKKRMVLTLNLEIVEFHEKEREVGYHQGVFLDIFPMLTLENTELNQKFYDEIFKEIRFVSSISLHTPEGKDDPVSRKKLLESLFSMP